MRTLILAVVSLFISSLSIAQKVKVPAKKYPSLLWEITGKGLKKPSYLFGTMHVSSKMVFHLSDSFYLGLKNADVVALETDMGTWQEDFSRYDLEGEGLYDMYQANRRGNEAPEDYFTINSLKFLPYAKLIEMALYTSPSMINNFLYRNNSARAADFEEDTYLDMHIYQAGKKWGKKVLGVENFDESMRLMKEAYEDAAKEKNKKERSYDFEEDLSYNKLEDAYRTGNLDWLDSINKVNSNSAAFDEKFLYKRNDIQAYSIDSILRTKQSLFVGVGAAHLPGERGVIETLRKLGYRLRPIKMTERDSRHKDEVEKIRVPVQFSRQTATDGFFSVNLPGKLYEFGSSLLPFSQQQFADMSNGSYYIVTRINTNSLMWGHNEATVLRKIDSVMYENIPGKILSKKDITKNGYKGFEVLNRTRRGDYQRYNIFATPFEIIIFKMSGNGEYVKEGREADQFFSSIQFAERGTGWKQWSPDPGGFEALFPHQPVLSRLQQNWQFMSLDKTTGQSYQVIRTDVHNYDFVEEDSFDLGLMEESFSNSEFIDKLISRKATRHNGYAALDAKYRYKDGSLAMVRFLVQGPHYYTLLAHGKTEHPQMAKFLNSFAVRPFRYGPPVLQTDTSLLFTVNSPVLLEKSRKLSLYPENIYNMRAGQDDDDVTEEQNTYKTRIIENDSTGEKVFVTFRKPSRYYFEKDTVAAKEDSMVFRTYKMDWVFRSRNTYTLPNKTVVFEYIMGEPKSSRYVRGKLFSRNGVEHRVETEGDTISAPSSFISSFFDSFQPVDTISSDDPKKRKTALFFADVFSSDTMQRKKALKSVGQIDFDAADLAMMQRAIASLSWKEKKYLDIKKDFVWQLSNIKTPASAEYLKQLYFAAGDTIDLQYTALDALLSQQTAHAFGVFRDIMVADPPVLGLDQTNTPYPRYRNITTVVGLSSSDYEDYRRTGSFLDNLSDSLGLTATIIKDLLPLINIHDYETPMMRLLGTMVDSNLVAASDYEIYLSKFLIEAKQLLKKQVIREKSKQIEKAQESENINNSYSYRNSDRDFGNVELSLYATLLMPFWDKNPAVPQLVSQLLKSSDNRLKYETVQMLLHYKKPLPDTMMKYFAAMDDYRFELYSDLKRRKQLKLFPDQYNNHVALARSRLMGKSGYDRPDTLVFIDRIALKHRNREGFVYFFKYKQKKEDNNWKLASVGLVPSNPGEFLFEKSKKYYEEQQYDFNQMRDTRLDEETPVAEQLKKALKKMQYSKRNSAVEFYSDDENDMGSFMKGFNFGE